MTDQDLIERIERIPETPGIAEPAGGDYRLVIPPRGGQNGHEIASLDGNRYENWPGFEWRLAEFRALPAASR